jgi:hypothetical protein
MRRLYLITRDLHARNERDRTPTTVWAPSMDAVAPLDRLSRRATLLTLGA